nr:PREDICTED: coagulation factor IX [Lepisosteus oculatus]
MMAKIFLLFIISVVTQECSHNCEASVFLSLRSASDVLRRERRYNKGFLEEMYPGNLERECFEEKCNFEEAREVFENKDKTMEFWYKYVDGDQCASSPCQNGGLCKDDINSYVCWCTSGFDGKNCEIETVRRCDLNNGGCMHFCEPHPQEKVACSCAKGYKLAENRRDCVAEAAFPCGKLGLSVSSSLAGSQSVRRIEADNETESSLPDNSTATLTPILADKKQETRIVGGNTCQPGEIPWQVVMIYKAKAQWFCGGSILSQNWIVTAAHCFGNKIPLRSIIIRAGEHDLTKDEGTESNHHIAEVKIHPQYNSTRSQYNHDIALVRLREPIALREFAVPVCLGPKDFTEGLMQPGDAAVVSGWGKLAQGGAQSVVLQKVEVPFVDRKNCKISSQTEVSRNMFCAGYLGEKKDSCQGDSGGPHVTKYKDTWFLTGIVSWGEGCALDGKYGVYTKVSQYYNWITNILGAGL